MYEFEPQTIACAFYNLSSLNENYIICDCVSIATTSLVAMTVIAVVLSALIVTGGLVILTW